MKKLCPNSPGLAPGRDCVGTDIEAYAFGEMRIAGRSYQHDLILFPNGTVNGNWRRTEGHRVAPRDIRALLSSGAEVVVFGTGASGCMKIGDEVRRLLTRAGVSVEVLHTSEAVERYNALRRSARRVAGAFHLTC